MARSHDHEGGSSRVRARIGLIVLVMTLGTLACGALLGPSPDVAAVFHGSIIGLLLLILPLSGAVRGKARVCLLTGVGTALVYVFLTSVPFVSSELVPWLPTEHLISRFGEEVLGDTDLDPPPGARPSIEHWSTQPLGSWGVYEDPTNWVKRWMSPRQIAFQRIGHDLAGATLGLIVALLTLLVLEEQPKRWDSDLLPADQGRGSPEALRQLMERGRGRGNQAPSTRA